MSNNLYQVEVEIENANYYPTASDRSVLLDRYTPDVISAKVSSGNTIVNPTKENSSNSTPFMMRNTYLKSVTPAGEIVEFRMKGSSKQTFTYTILGNNPANATLSLSLNSPMGGTDQIEIKLVEKK